MLLKPSDIPDTEIRQWYKSQLETGKYSKCAALNPMNPPSILQIEVTKNCNLRCIMCHKGQVPDFDRTDISSIVLEQVKCLYPHLKHAMLFGDGEPMVYTKFWDIVRDIRKASPSCKLDFINNGTLMTEANIRKCLQYEINAMGLSLGGATPTSHDYIRKGSSLKQIINNFENLQSAKKEWKRSEPYVTAHIVIMQSNYQEIIDFVEMCHNLGFYSINCQQLFVTDVPMKSEVVASDEVEPYFKRASELSQKLGINFGHYPLASGHEYVSHEDPDWVNHDDLFFRRIYDRVDNGGYCKNQQPWNTVYVLHDGAVVPDCHWWASSRDIHLNNCGWLDENTDILDIWNGKIFNEIRRKISRNDVLPQCRGCGLAGGVLKKFRSENTDHIDPNQECNSQDNSLYQLGIL